MFAGLTGIHIVIIIGVVVLLFGATRLPVFSKSLGQSIKIFRKEMHDVKSDVDDDRRKDDRRSDERRSDDRRTSTEDRGEPVVYTNEPPAGSAPRDSSGR